MYTLCCPCLHVPVGSRRAMGVRWELLWNELMDCVIGPASGSSIGLYENAEHLLPGNPGLFYIPRRFRSPIVFGLHVIAL